MLLTETQFYQVFFSRTYSFKLPNEDDSPFKKVNELPNGLSEDDSLCKS